MTDTEINVAIAGIMGWDFDPEEAHSWRSRSRWCKSPCGEMLFRHNIPNYCGSLDAMRKALDSMSFSKRQAYYSNLIEVMSQSLRSENPRLFRVADIECCLATAKQQAETFLRVHGKWID
jgi:hypothetical protein